ncbi:hypothetical protein ATN84_16905 [Paramesorhizobium deserti]|uniref:Uncharacterized protein n=1 Tax=Paramesorhizobium deserti TaxID=1494590 RepID=A0A135HR48_9HYPH|nr:hypothetical protein ATN84_16905 [Paramesorhizobium deserti]
MDGWVFGVNLPETAVDVDEKHDKSGFSCDAYFDAEMQNPKTTRVPAHLVAPEPGLIFPVKAPPSQARP